MLVRLGAVAGLCVFLCACATAGDTAVAADPLEPVNREIFAVNQKLDNQVALPLATFYRSAAPGDLREHVHDFLSNLHLPVTLANDILEGRFEQGGEAFGRFSINSTLGVAGMFDFATGWGLPYHQKDFGQTVGQYGVPPGPYLVLPLLGPADVRDVASEFVDRYFDPLGYVSFRNHLYWTYMRSALSFLDSRSRSVDQLRDIQRSSVDLYATTRSLYLQSREAAIRNGEPDVQGLPDF